MGRKLTVTISISLIILLISVNWLVAYTRDNPSMHVVDPDFRFNILFGGNHIDTGNSIAIDEDNALVFAGYTNSTDFPILNAFDASFNDDLEIESFSGGSGDGFIAKMTGEGELVWSTYFGGNNKDEIHDIDVDHLGNIVVVGETRSKDFPVLNAYDPLLGGFTIHGEKINHTNTDAFISKFSADGDLVWSTFLGGTSTDKALGLKIDSQNNIVVTGMTNSYEQFPLLDGYDETYTYSEGAEVFITKLSPGGDLVWSTYFGGDGDDTVYSINLDSNDDIVISGNTWSEDFPSQNGYDSTYSRWGDAFVSKFNSNGSLAWSTYLGGDNQDAATAIATNSQNNVIVTGYTFGISDDDDEEFPILNAYDPAINSIDGFVTTFSSNGTLLMSTYFGGSAREYAEGIAVDTNDHVFITGYIHRTNTFSDNADDGMDTFIVEFTPSGEIVWTSYITNNENTEKIWGRGQAVTLDNGFPVVIGNSAANQFPLSTSIGSIEDEENILISYLLL